MHGKGLRKYANGSLYEGDWREDQKHGIGRFRDANGETYRGLFRENKKHGKGVSVFSVQGMVNEPGLDYFWNAGDKYDGEYKANVRHGACVYTFFNGETLACTWVEGRCPEFTARQSAVRTAAAKADPAAEAKAAARANAAAKAEIDAEAKASAKAKASAEAKAAADAPKDLVTGARKRAGGTREGPSRTPCDPTLII